MVKQGERQSKVVVYTGLGLVEALIAIVVAGIACLVFMQVTSQSIVELIRIEQYDELTRESSVTAEKVRRIIGRQNGLLEGNVDLFPIPPADHINKCYSITGGLLDPAFDTDQLFTPTCLYDNEMSGCRTAFSGSSEKIFTVYCIRAYDNNTGLVKGEVISGLLSCQVRKDGKCIVLDHSMVVMMRLE